MASCFVVRKIDTVSKKQVWKRLGVMVFTKKLGFTAISNFCMTVERNAFFLALPTTSRYTPIKDRP